MIDRTHTALLCLALAAGLAAATPLRAGELLVNGGFDTDLSGWLAPGVTWSPLDADNDPASGSARLTDPATGPGVPPPLLVHQCATLTRPTHVLAFSMRGLLPGGQPSARITATLNVHRHSPDCSGGAVAIVPLTTTLSGAWIPLSQTLAFAGELPAGASVAVTGRAERDGLDGPVFGHLDRVSVAQDGLLLAGFELPP